MKILAALVVAATAVAMGWSTAKAGDVEIEPFGFGWIVVENQPCQVWYADPEQTVETATWTGTCIDGKASDEGELNFDRGKFIGKGVMRAGKMHGLWRMESFDGSTSVGQFHDGLPHGRLASTLPNGQTYECKFEHGVVDPLTCKLYSGPPSWAEEESEKSFESDWILVKNQPCRVWAPGANSETTITWSGDCVDGKISGEGREVWSTPDGEWVYEGSMWEGKAQGWGIHVRPDGTRYEGEMRDGYLHGRITVIDSNGASRTCVYSQGIKLSCTLY